ncbi:MAG: hypothetical protein IJU50_11580 [Lachnospiraceae bacterium]|nr:hypothetical protein [Lachnospiraceae bacterium]
MTVQINQENRFTGAFSSRAYEGHGEGKGREAIYGGNIGVSQGARQHDALTERMGQAKKQAFKIVSDAFVGEKKLDDGLQEIRSQIGDWEKEIGENQDEIKRNNEKIAALAKEYGVDLESGEEGPSEFQERAKALKGRNQSLERDIEKNYESIEASNRALTDTKIDRLKTHPILDAVQKKDEVLKAASDEVLGMAFQEGLAHLEEKTEETKDEQEKLAEKKREEEEQLEKAKARREEEKEEMEDLIEGNLQKEIPSGQAMEEQAKGQVEKLLNKMSLLEEDIKGIQVDEEL